MKSRTDWIKKRVLPAAGALCLTLAMSASAQVQTQTTTTTGQSTKQVTVDRGVVVEVQGNDLIVRMEDGMIRHFPNIPESTRIDVDGKELSIHELKPGMRLQRTITTTTTPQVVTTVQTVTGRVFHVNAPNSVILTLEDGTNQSFKIPKGQKFNIDGQETDAFGLRKGMRITATKIVEEPITVAEHQREVTGTMPPAPQAPPPDVPILVVMAVPVPSPAPSTEEASTKLPKTGSVLPLVGFLGVLCLLSGLAIKLVRGNVGF
jgi:stage V sporulation protein SpoVS